MQERRRERKESTVYSSIACPLSPCSSSQTLSHSRAADGEAWALRDGRRSRRRRRKVPPWP
eukprot:757626-Hanusia_phi.AAC.2